MENEKTIEGGAEVTRRDAVKMAALAVGAVALGSAGVAGGGIAAPEEALAASKTKYACQACGKKYTSKAKADACAKKQENAFSKKANTIYKNVVKDFSKAVPSVGKPKFYTYDADTDKFTPLAYIDKTPTYLFYDAFAQGKQRSICKKYNLQMYKAAKSCAPYEFESATKSGVFYVSRTPDAAQFKCNGESSGTLLASDHNSEGYDFRIPAGGTAKVRFRFDLIDRGTSVTWKGGEQKFRTLAKSKWSKWVTVKNPSKTEPCRVVVLYPASSDITADWIY